MSLDESARSGLKKAVQACRRILTRDLTETLEGTYGVHRSGRFEPLSALPGLQQDATARETRELLERVLPPPATAPKQREAFAESFDAVLRSLAFTHLNRLVAFKMMEQPDRKIIKETLGKGLESRGFKFYLADRSEEEALWRGGQQVVAYEHFLLWQCSELNRDIGVLFDPDDLASRIFPRPAALAEVLASINSSDLAGVWSHEETIGWVYQYYTSKEEREEARKKSAAPRNSWEMAFRNQFYTPDYVVRFLVDNTLGRIWLEMKPDTALRDQCELLVIRPDETLRPRIAKDPREFRIIDPACGSGHFLLYAFDLLETIYREAWDDAKVGEALRVAWPSREAFESAIPALIVENNLHGIDIDRRAVQLASLTLFLKARSRNPRARIERGHIVCAEPMPGTKEQFEDFKARELSALGDSRAVFARILDGLREHLALAGEAGSLLLAEREVGRLIADLRAKPLIASAEGSGEGARPNDEKSQASDDAFWADVERQVETLFAAYASEASGAEGAHRRIFARDGVDVLRFIDTLRTCYDVVLMNPPFGAATKGSKEYIDRAFPRTKNDVYSAFVECWLDRVVDRGRLGAITSRTGFFLKSFARWRQEVLLSRADIDPVADLGQGVLDAMVETASYVLERSDTRDSSKEALFFRLLNERHKEQALAAAVSQTREGKSAPLVIRAQESSLRLVPGSPFAYWVSHECRNLFATLSPAEGTAATIRVGLQTSDNFRFLRLHWETAGVADGRANGTWFPFAKGGDFSPYWYPIDLQVNWQDHGAEMKEWANPLYDHSGWSRIIKSTEFYFRAGLTWPFRSQTGLSVRAMPSGCIFAHMGPAMFARGQYPLGVLLALYNSCAGRTLVDLQIGFAAYEVGALQRLPVPSIEPHDVQHMESAALSIIRPLTTINVSHTAEL